MPVKPAAPKAKEPDQQVKVRIPPDLKERIEASATSTKRSINADIIGRLEQSFETQRQLQFLKTKTDADSEELFRTKAMLKELQASAAAGVRYQAEAESLTKELARQEDMVRSLTADVEVLRNSLQREYESRKVLDAKRLPEGLARRIQQAAVQRHRPFEEEVTQALEKAYPPPDAFKFIAEMTLLLKPLENWEHPNPNSETSRAIANTRNLVEYMREEYAAGREEGAFDRYYQVFEVGPDGIRRRREDDRNVSS